MDRKAMCTRYQRSNSEQLEVNAKLFSVIRKRNISKQEKFENIQTLLRQKPQPDINAQDGNDNWNTALHLAVERNELELVSFLLSQGADTAVENGDGKMPLQLAEECNNVEIIDVLQSFTSQLKQSLSKTHKLASHTSQPVVTNRNAVSVFHSNSQAAVNDKQTASTVLPPFSGELRVDKKLKLSHDNFKQSIKVFLENKQLSAIDQLKATPPYPTPHVLAQFASMAYSDSKHGDPKTLAGWQLLTTASHFGIKNGYFGTAYWHPEHQQVVIAHRGTDIKNVGALVTDLNGILFNNYVNQMSSASTFASNVVAVLQEIEQQEKVSFELFFTGHSLGGWLAQITTFTTEYLEVKGGTFLKKLKTEQNETLAISTVQDSLDITHSYHPHTVVFDSPGCKDMLSQMVDKLDVRLNGRSIDLQHLDITSYLSAPNRINTCNSHLGTVYRIFTDLSDMGFIEQNTPLYNLATHSMDKIMQAFDSETGQVHKDNKGRLKIQEVVDWPVSAGLTGGAELNDFFKWAEHLNNYHPEVKDISHSKALKGYHPLRYQTKAYNECTNRLSIFSEDQREFMERYRWLCQVKEFFKPEDQFSVMNNAEVEKEVEQNLQNFELDNESVRCPDANTLHALIPYVKRMVRLFPHIIENIKAQLSSPKIRNRVYQYETQRYVENIRQSTLDFNPGTLGLREFLIGDKQFWHLQMVDGDGWTGVTKVYRVLQNTSCTANYSSEGHYTILKLKRLLTVNRMINLNALLASIESPHLLMIACGTNQPVNDDLRDMFKELIIILKQKKNMKIILTTSSENSAAAFLQQIAIKSFGERFITTAEQLTWSDLTDSSQTNILKETVIFQGTRVALNQITSVESMTDSFPLTDLLQEKELTIGEEPVLAACIGYNEKFYIDRIFNHNIVIRQDILNDEEEKLEDLLASTEQEFKQLCNTNPTSNVHWLVKNKTGELIWQQTQGNLKTLCRYIDAQQSHSYARSDLDKLLQQAKQQRVMLIADKAGMGKTTVLTHLSKCIKQKYPAHWLVRIDLNDYTELFEAQKGKKMDKVGVLEFLSKEVLKLESHLEKELFKKSFEGNEVNKVVVMVDGFDEISPRYKDTVIDMLQVLKQTLLEQLWVTTRPHLREELENNLQQLSYTLQPFTEIEQVEFLKKFWFQNSNLEDKDQYRLQIYAEALIRNLAQSISDKDKEFTGIPLQTRMLAEAFEPEFISFYLSAKSEPELSHKLDLVGLYRRFIDRKYNIHYREKSKIPASNMAAEEQRNRDFNCIQLEHQLLALEALFAEHQVSFLQIDHYSRFSDEELARIGIAQRNNEGKPQFIHRTFAEFYVADFLVNQLVKKTKQHVQVQELLLNKVLLEMDCRVIRAFLDGLLGTSKPSKEALKDYGEELDKQWYDRKVHRALRVDTTPLHEAAKEVFAHIVGFLLDSLKSAECLTTLTKMLLAQDIFGQYAWHLAAKHEGVQVLKMLWEWAEEVTTTLTYSLLLSQDRDSESALQLAAKGGHIKVVEKLWSWAKEAQIKHGELENELLLPQDSEGRTAWHVTAKRSSVELKDELWGWAKVQLPQPDLLKNKLLLSRDVNGSNAWQLAASTGSVEVLGSLWDWTKEMKLKPEKLRNAFLSGDNSGQTAWHMAAGGGHVEVLDKLCDWAKELQLEPWELRDEVFLLTDRIGRTVWHVAAEGGHIEILEKLWDWAKEEKLDPYCLKSVLFLHDRRRAINISRFQVTWIYSTWCYAIYKGNIDVIQKLWSWAEELQLTPDELKNKLFLDIDLDGNSAIYRAARTGSLEVLEKLWSLSKETQLQHDGLSKMLLAAWHKAAARGSQKILERLWLWAGEVKLNTHELKRRLLLDQNKDGNVAWHMAAAGGHVEVLEKLWAWAKTVKIKPEQLSDTFFLDEHVDGSFTWHPEVSGANVEVSVNLLGLNEEAQINADDLRSAMLLARNKRGETARKLAELNGRKNVLQKIFDLEKDIQLDPVKVRNRLLLDQEEDGRHAWFLAAKSGNVKLLEEVWVLARQKGNTKEMKSKLLVAKNEYGETALHLAIRGSVAVLEKMWAFAKEAQINVEVLKNKLLLAKDIYGYTAWHGAAERGNLMALEILWSWAKEAELNPVELLLAQNEEGETAFHMAADGNDVKMLQKMCVWAEEAQSNSNELKNKLLRGKDIYGYSAWHRAAERGNLVALEILWSWAKEAELNPDELLLTQNEEGETALHIAAYIKHVEILQKMCVWAEEAQSNSNELKNKLLRGKDVYGYSAWHRAAERGNLVALEILWSWAKEAELNPDELLLTQNEEGETALHIAENKKHVEILRKMCVWAEEAQPNSNELKNILLLAKDKYGYSAWHRGAERGNLVALEILWSGVKEAELNPDELLLVKNKRGETALHIAALENHTDILQKMLVWAKEQQMNPNDLKKNLLLAKDKFGYTAWHRAAERGNLMALEILWSGAEEAELNPDELLLAQNKRGETVLHIAAKKTYEEILQQPWARVVEEEMYPNERRGTDFHMAAKKKYEKILQVLWDWAKKVPLKPKELRKTFLLAKDMYGNTAWHQAAERGNLVALEIFWIWAKEVKLKPDELLLAQNEKGETAWHMAAKKICEETLKNRWGCVEETQLNSYGLRNERSGGKDRYGNRAQRVGILKTLRMRFKRK